MPPLLATADVSVASQRRHRPARALSPSSLTFALLMLIATCVPINALLSTSDVLAASRTGKSARVVAGPAQGLHNSVTSTETIRRDEREVSSLEQVITNSRMRTANTFTNNSRGTVQWPFPTGVPITDGFGPRSAPTNGASTLHQGADFTPGEGVPIQIIADGTVRSVSTNNNSCGVHVVIDHTIRGRHISSTYCHMQVGSVRVNAGQQVKVADIVGRVGNTGVSTGAHLHLEIRLDGRTAVDPIAWLKANAD